MLIKYGECLNVSKELLPYIDNKNIVNKFKKFYIQNGDVIIADTAEDETVGKCIEISGIIDHNIISGLHTIPLRPVNKFAYGYLGFYLNSNSYHNQLKPLMQGIKVTSISKNLLKTTTLNYPSNIQEQKIIGRYFDALNHLITLHQSKSFGHILEMIVSCTLSWEQRKLGEIADKIVEKNFQLQERDVFTNSAEFGIIDQKDFFDHEIVNKNNIGGYYIVSPNDFVYNPRISVTAPVGPINRNKLCKRGIMSPLYTVFHLRKMNEIFLEFFFKTNKWHKFMEYNGDSGARSDRFSIKTELFYAMTIPFPSHEEQSKVGICFESIDHLITLHQLEPFQLIFKAIAYRIIDYAKSKPPRHRK